MAQLSVMPIRLALDLIEHIWRCAFALSGLRMNAVHDIHAREPIANRLLLSLPPEIDKGLIRQMVKLKKST